MYSTFLYMISTYRFADGLTFTSEREPCQAASRRAVAGDGKMHVHKPAGYFGVEPKFGNIYGILYCRLTFAQALVVYTVEENRKPRR